jgi:probable O-glycosylation ligase (exosortase A-associated)
MGTLRNSRGRAPGVRLENTGPLLETSSDRSALRPQITWWHPGERESDRDSAARRAKVALETPRGSSGAFFALLVFTFVLLISPQSIFPALAQFRLAWLAASASVGLLLLDRIPRGSPLIVSGRETWAVVGIVAWATLTIPFSYWPGGSFSVLTDIYSKTLVIFWLLALTVNTQQRLVRVAWALSLMALPIAYTGVSNYRSGNFMAGGLGDRIVGYEGALTQNPNDLALMLNLIIPLTVALLSVHRRLLGRLTLLTVLVLSIAAIVYTRSRSGFLTTVTVFLFYAWKLSRRGRIGWPIAILVLALVCAPLLPEGYLSRINTITNIDEDQTGSAQGRWEGMKVGTTYLLEHPLVGAGMGMNSLALNEVVGPSWHDVHNVYLQYGMDLGVPGLFFFLMIVVGSFQSTIVVCRRSAGAASLATLFHLSEGLQGSLCAFVVGAIFSPVAYNFYFYYLAGLAIGIRQAIGSADVEAEEPRSSGIRGEQRPTRPFLQHTSSR